MYIFKSCIDLQNKEGLAQKLDLPRPVNDPNKVSGVSVVSVSPLIYVLCEWMYMLHRLKALHNAHCKNLMKIFQSQKTRQMKWAWNCSVLLVILAKMQIFKANFQPDGRKMQKNFISKSFSKRLKKFANVGSLAEGWRLKKLFRFL